MTKRTKKAKTLCTNCGQAPAVTSTVYFQQNWKTGMEERERYCNECLADRIPESTSCEGCGYVLHENDLNPGCLCDSCYEAEQA